MISKIENDQFSRSESVSLAELVAEVSEEVQDRLEVLNLTLTQQIEPDFVVTHCNRVLLFTLLYNLVSNVLGGSITAHSAPGAGARFVLRLPAQAPTHSGPAPLR